MEPCGLASRRRLALSRLTAYRKVTLLSVLAACIGIIPNAWATPAPTTTTLTVTSSGSNVTSVTSGTVVTLTATVVSGSTPVTPGQVKFCDASAAHCEDSALLATAQLTTVGVATYKFRPGIGSHSYQAVFVGTDSYAKSTSTTAALAATGPTITTITASGSTGNYTLTTTVIGIGSRTLFPTGEVSFLDVTNGQASLGTATLGTATAGQSYTVGSAPDAGRGYSIAVGDLNGDGIPDLVTGNYSQPGTVTVLLGNGDGTFFTEPAISDGTDSPTTAAVGDFNADGIPDLAVTDENGSAVKVLLGKGDGTFTIEPSTPLPGIPFRIAVGDFNGDGLLDLAVTTNGTVTILLGDGNGNLTIKSSPTVGPSPQAIAVGDFNGDGILDLATANGGDGTVAVLLGNGDGTFTTKSTPSVGSTPFWITQGDFNGDGIPDLATANWGDNTVTVLLGKGDGTFTLKSSPAVGNEPASIAVGDFNADGIADLATANEQDSTITVLLGKGDGTFTTQTTLSVGGGPNHLAVGDFNGDGISDIAADGSATTVAILLDQITQTAIATLNDVSVSTSETHQVEASYAGDANFSASTSGTFALTTSKTPTTLELSSSAATSMIGDQVTLTAVLKPSSSLSSTTNGEIITFYSGGIVVGTATLYRGIATLYVRSLLPGTDMLTATYAGDANFSGTTSNVIIQTVTNVTVPTYVVNVNTDSAAGVASNCTGGGSSSCSLRDALAASATNGGNITFDPVIFSTPQTITLNPAGGPVTGGLTVPSNTTITGPTTGSGATLTNLVTVNGGNSVPVFTITGTNASISGLTITGGFTIYNGGGVASSGSATISNCTITGNRVSTYGVGAGISAGGNLTLINTTVSNNTGDGTTPAGPVGPYFAVGGGIYNNGTLTLLNSTVSGNTIIAAGGGAGIFNDRGTVNLIESTVFGNYFQGGATGASLDNSSSPGTLAITNSIVAGNTGGSDCSGSGCPTNGVAGNVTGVDPMLYNPFPPFYLGPTQNFPPHPGSPAICAGIVADSPGVTTDQRGFARTTTYGTNPPCVDSGSVQTHYSLSFSTEPPAIVAPGKNFTASVTLSEGGIPFPNSGITIPLALGPGSTGTLSGGSAATDATGTATYSSLQVNSPGSGDTLVATLPLTASGITPAAAISATSSVFNAITPGTPVAQPLISPPSGTYTSAQSVTITDTISGATIYYTTDGSVPSRSSAVFSGTPITVSSSQTVKALAVAPNYATSPESVAIYTIIPPYAAAPTFSLPPGSYQTAQTVSLFDATPGAKIYYTTDHSVPTTSSTLYTGGSIAINITTQLKAIAVATGYSTSPIAVGDYNIAATQPVISPPTGHYTGAQMVTITSSIPGATIFYTTDGSTPNWHSPVFNPASPIVVTSSQTIKALAWAPGYTTSPEGVAILTITP